MTRYGVSVDEVIDRAVAHNLRRGKSKLEALHIAAGFLNNRWLQETGYKVACHKGCSFCCNQIVAIGGFEGQHIYWWICSQPLEQRRQILTRMYERIRQFQSWAREQGALDWLEKGFDLRRPSEEAVQEILRVIELSKRHQQPCIFLDEQGGCGVYPARPMVCRTARSLEVCGSGRGAKELRSPFDEGLEVRVAQLEDIEYYCHQGRNWLPLPLVMDFTAPEKEWNGR